MEKGLLGRVTYCEGEYVGYKGTLRFHQDWKTGEFVYPEDLAAHPDARPTWSHIMAPIHYLPHDLSPLLTMLDDRVVEVTAMSTRSPSYYHPEINRADIQVALMKTEKDTLLRLMCGFTQPTPNVKEHHRYRIIGTEGTVESARSTQEPAKLWLADAQMPDMADVEWSRRRTDAPPEALATGHNGTDYYVHTTFRDALLSDKPTGFDVYQAVDTAAPAILAADSIDQGSELIKVPDFRPSAARPAGHMPKE